MTVVAEGIEDESQLTESTRLGCHTGQGYYFSAALETAPVEKLLDSCRVVTGVTTGGLVPQELPWKSANL